MPHSTFGTIGVIFAIINSSFDRGFNCRSPGTVSRVNSSSDLGPGPDFRNGLFVTVLEEIFKFKFCGSLNQSVWRDKILDKTLVLGFYKRLQGYIPIQAKFHQLMLITRHIKGCNNKI